MPLTMTDTEYHDGLTHTPERLMITRAKWDDTPAEMIVRDIVDQFVSPKCYLIVPGHIASGQPLMSITLVARTVAEALTTLAVLCGMHWWISMDGRLHFT